MDNASEQPVSQTEGDTPALLPREKAIVLDSLLDGKTVEEAAAAANVCKRTVERWRDHDAEFIAERNRRLKSSAAASQDRIQSVGSASLEIVLDSIRKDKNVASARMVIRSLGLLKHADSGPTTAADISRKQELDERERKLKEQQRADELDELELQQVARRAERKKKLRELQRYLNLNLNLEPEPDGPSLDGASA